MPSDIRNFFGGRPASSPAKPSPSKPADAKKTRGKRKVVDDSDDEDNGSTAKSAPQQPAAKKRAATPEGEATTTSDYFGKSKPKKSSPVKTSAPAKQIKTEIPKPSPTKSKSTPKSTRSQASSRPTPNGRTSGRRKPPVNYSEDPAVNGTKILDDDFEGDDDIFATDFKATGKVTGDDYQEDDSAASDQDPKPKRTSTGRAKQTKAKKKPDDDDDDDAFAPDQDVEMDDVEPEDDFVALEDEEDEEDAKPIKPAKTAKASATPSRKRKSTELDDEEDSDEAPKRSAAKRKPTSKRSSPKKAKKEEVQDSAEIQAIFDSIPLVRPPTPPASSGEKKKFPFGGQHANSGAPPAQGSKEPPIGAENCLAGLSFVFTGLLDTLQRDDGAALVKRYGGKVMGAPSSKTSYVVLGNDAGPKKLEVIAKNNIKTINEDGLFELIRRMPANGGDSKAAAANEQKKNDEMEKIKQMAAEAEAEDKRKAEAEAKRKAAAAAASSSGPAAPPKAADAKSTAALAIDTRLWTVKHAPTQINQICGNKTQVEKLQKWLRMFPKNQRTGFKLGGADGSGTYRAVIIYGPPGIGKTTAAHLVAKLEGYDVVESNASDTRSKKLVEVGLKGVLDTTSLLGYFAGAGEKVDKAKKKLVLIMDEVDGMSAGDRGGVGALAAVCKKTTVPMILICNDRKLPKMRPFDNVTYGLQFRRPTVDQIRARIMTINFREQMKMPSTVIDALIEGSGADIRQVVNMISTAKVDQGVSDQTLDFDRGKQMSKAWEKHIVLKPWDIVGKILGGGMFASASKATLNDKIELYFNDHEFSSLMLQENYLGTKPILANNYHGREQSLKTLELVEKAASSISEGDLVDRMIHGTQQHWSLMPTHAVFSFVRPASFVAGSMAGHSTNFTAWLGKNSTLGRLSRMVKEIQGHMRLRASGDRHEIRQQYVPLLWSRLVKRLELQGRDCVPQVIELMDSYFLTKDDWDAILELGVGPMDQEGIKIESATKATFTRLYNSQSHPLPFMKASNVIAPKNAAKEKPDLEEAIEESDDGGVADDEAKDPAEQDEADGDVLKDKYVKQPKKSKGAAAAKSKKKANKDDEDAEDVSDEEVKPKKGKSKGKGKK